MRDLSNTNPFFGFFNQKNVFSEGKLGDFYMNMSKSKHMGA